MTLEEIVLRRLDGQYIPAPADTQTVIKDLCGVQAQFLGHALHGLSIRCNEISIDGLVKSWTNRGTMHLFSVDDLPVFLHRGRTHFLRPVDMMDSDVYITAERKAYFRDLITDAIAQGIDERESLKHLCEEAGMTETESKSLFDPWGGIIRALCETGQLCHKVQEKKAYQLCPAFVPMEAEPARLELAKRYFTHFGPATVKDAACFFGTTQATVRAWLSQLPVKETGLDGRSYFYIDRGLPSGEIPPCLFLAGFDQLMLGYEKKESLFLPKEHIRDVFTLSGIVRPAILVHGRVAGWWNLKNRKLKVLLFSPAHRELIHRTAPEIWTNLKQIEYI